MNRADALRFVSVVVDDALNGQQIEKPEFVVNTAFIREDARLVGWQCGFEPLFVAVQSYLPGIRIDDDDAIELATDFLSERGWFGDTLRDPDHLI